MSAIYTDELFAPLDKDLQLERIGGGNETEVYCTDDRRFVVKVKSEEQQTLQEALRKVQQARASATAFAAAVGSEHSIPNYYLLARNSVGEVQPVVLQPYLGQAQSLAGLKYEELGAAERQHIAGQLRQIIRRSLDFYHQTGQLPDLYGRTSSSQAERKQLNRLWMLPWRLWSFLVKRNLLRAHNLMLTETPERRIVLIDYDPVQRSQLYRFVYYNVRRFLFWRDYLLLWVMEKTGYVPKA